MKWVLVIEPSEVDREYLERIITRLGYQFFAARSGEEALHFMTQSLPDTIIVGERIPDYDPMEFARHIKEDHILSGPPILLMSSNTDDPYKSAALQAGFEQIVQRPMSIRSFFTKLEMCMSNNRHGSPRPAHLGKENTVRDNPQFRGGGYVYPYSQPSAQENRGRAAV
jgi:DNA-binding response OmpR family regulator